EYGFNKSHSAAYAAISYQTAFLKAHYPVEFMAALLTSEKDNRDKIIKYISSCKDMGISVLPPDINESQRDFSVAGDNIRFGLAAVKNVGASAIDSIISVRRSKGEFTSFHDFCDRIDLRKVNKRVIESLIKCGAFDSLKYNRRQLFLCYEGIMDSIQKRQIGRNSGQSSFFDVLGAPPSSAHGPTTEGAIPDVPEWEQGELLAYEKDTLGFYITSHPLTKFADRLGSFANADSSNIAEKKDKDAITFGGIVNNIREVTTKKKDVMAYVTIEDLKGSITAIFFADIYKNAYDLLHGEQPVLIKGTLDMGEESFKVIASEISPLTEAVKQVFNSVHFMIDVAKASPDDIESLSEVVKRCHGKSEGFIHLLNGKSETVVYLGDDCRLEISDHLKKEADRILSNWGQIFFLDK
ncbi:MAG: DNA polymerase III subunit alpha, partial [Syntrophales bacterium]|nr:DNA polymerase III subunit alpha [Syntrophales bacterium]